MAATRGESRSPVLIYLMFYTRGLFSLMFSKHVPKLTLGLISIRTYSSTCNLLFNSDSYNISVEIGLGKERCSLSPSSSWVSISGSLGSRTSHWN
jgi:hypothetical protein